MNMNERNTSIRNPQSGFVQAPVARPKSGGAFPDPAGRVPETARRTAPTRDPYNIRAAFDRLAKLLSRDTEGQPQAGLPPRGYYLNILV